MSQQKIFNDPIHGHIEMHPLFVEIIDTPQFQRLRNIKQLGGGYFVYPGASHNRFEHSIGVCHLAGKLIKILQERQRESKTDENRKITEKDVLCVQIAGLCHDLGHGPFSHVFEVFMREAGEEQDIEWMKKWEHEEQSVEMFEALLREETEQRKIEKLMRDVHGFTDEDFQFIKDLIKGKQSPDGPTTNRALVRTLKTLLKTLTQLDDSKDEMEKLGIPKDTMDMMNELSEKIKPHANTNQQGEDETGTRSDKSFLYEIVANKRTGIDVDKMDYLSRDCHHLGMKCNFDHERYMMFARVCGNQICVRDKEARNMYELFHARHSLHSRASKHPVKKLVERMIVDALLEAERAGFQIPGIGKKITEAVMDEKSYLHLTDDILQEIMRWSPEGSPSGGSPSGGSPSKDDVPQEIMQLSPQDSQSEDSQSEAAKLIKRIRTRKLYQCIGTTILAKKINNKDLRCSLKKNMKKILEELKKAELGKLETPDLEVMCFNLDYGKEENDPIDSLGFYRKTNPDKMIHLDIEEVSHLLPVRFTETKVMLYYKGETKLTLHEEEMKEPLRRCWNILVPEANGQD